jgi:hypothetical protein
MSARLPQSKTQTSANLLILSQFLALAPLATQTLRQ